MRPPYDADAEGSVLAACLQSTNALAEVVEQLRPEDFFSPGNRLIFAAARELFSKGEAVDTVIVAAALASSGELDKAGGKVALTALVSDHPTSFKTATHARIVHDLATLRRLMSVGREIHDYAASRPDDATEAVDRCEGLVFAIRDSETRSDVAPVRDSLSAEMEALERRQQVGGDVQGLPTGFAEFDQMTTGLLPGQFVLLGARPSMGKTAMLANITFNAACLGRTVAFWSLEMGRSEMTQRFLSATSGVGMKRIRGGNLREQDWGALSGSLPVLSEAPIYLSTPSSLSFMELRAQARRLKAKKGLDLVVVDYLGLMETTSAENRNQEISALSRSLKMLARDLDCPVLVATQLNRGLELRSDKRPILSDLRDSGSLEQDADIVVFLYRDAVYNERASETEAELIVAKHRNGPTGHIPMTFLGDFVRFSSRIDTGRAA